MAELIDREKDTVYACKWQLNTVVFKDGEEKIEFQPSSLLGFEKLDDFEQNIRSLMKLTLRVDIRQKTWILKHKKTLTVKFELDKVGMDSDAESLFLGPEAVYNTDFSIFLNDDDEAMDTESLEESIKANEGDEFKASDIEDQSYYEADNQFEVYLFEPKLLTASNKTYNKVFTKAPMQDMIGELLTETGHKKVLMSRIENDEVYQEMLIPSNPAYKGLIYLDQYYGFYKRGAIIFYDVDKLYIINPNGKVTAKEQDEWTQTTFLVTADDSTTPGNGMVRKPDEKIFYINIPEESVKPEKPSIAKNAEQGSNAKIVISDDINVEEAEANQDYIGGRKQYTQYVKKDDNKFVTSMVQARMEENDCVLMINGENLDMAAFTPNKEFRVIFADQTKQDKYGKFRYRLAYASHVINVESEQYMTSSHQIALKKCSDLEGGE